MVATQCSSPSRSRVVVPAAFARRGRPRNSVNAGADPILVGPVHAPDSSRPGSRGRVPRTTRELPLPPTRTFLDLDDPALQNAVNAGIKAEAARHGLQELVVVQEEGDIPFQMNVARTVRNSPCRTASNDDSFLCPFWRFCAETGNYASMLILLFENARDPQLPGRVPAMEPEAIAGFLRYMKKQTTVVLRNGDARDSAPIVRVRDGTQIMCTHTWKGNAPMDTFLSLLEDVHVKHGHSGPFERRCQDCVETAGPCCARHLDARRCHAIGNPINTPIVRAAVKSCETPVASFLYAGDVRTLREYLLSPGQTLPQFVANLGLYVLMLLSITQLMRYDEALSLTWESFDGESNFFLEDEDGVLQALALCFVGKTDERTIRQFVNANPRQSELDPVRHLLLYIYLIQKLVGNPEPSGFLFMPAAHLSDPLLIPHDGCFRETISNAGIRSTLQNLLMTVLDIAMGSVTIGLHMFCKTGYFFRVWALGRTDRSGSQFYKNLAIVRNDVRHISDADATKYDLSAWSSTRLLAAFDDPRHRVLQTQSIRLTETNRSADALNRSRIKGWTINEIAKDFVERHLSPAGYRNHDATFQNLFERRPPGTTHLHQRDQLMARLAGLPEAALEDFLEAFEQRLPSRSHSERTPPNHRQNPSPAVVATVGDISPIPGLVLGQLVPVRVHKKRKYGENDLVIRRQFTGKRIDQVVGLLHEVAQIRSTLRPNELTTAAKKWLSEGYTPAMRCFKNHHASNDEAFSARWAGVEWSSTFKKKRCCGKPGSQCGI